MIWHQILVTNLKGNMSRLEGRIYKKIFRVQGLYKTIVNRLLFLIVRYWLLKNLKALYRFDITVVLYMYTVFL